MTEDKRMPDTFEGWYKSAILPTHDHSIPPKYTKEALQWAWKAALASVQRSGEPYSASPENGQGTESSPHPGEAFDAITNAFSGQDGVKFARRVQEIVAEQKATESRVAIDRVLIAGNHLATALLNRNIHPAEYSEADQIGKRHGIEAMDIWIAWRAIMDLRDQRSEISETIPLSDIEQEAISETVPCDTCGKPVPDRGAEKSWCGEECAAGDADTDIQDKRHLASGSRVPADLKTDEKLLAKLEAATSRQPDDCPKHDVVADLLLYGTHTGADYLAKFSYRWQNAETYEVVMNFRDERRFALCSHENDAQVITDALNSRHSERESDSLKAAVRKLLDTVNQPNPTNPTEWRVRQGGLTAFNEVIEELHMHTGGYPAGERRKSPEEKL